MWSPKRIGNAGLRRLVLSVRRSACRPRGIAVCCVGAWRFFPGNRPHGLRWMAPEPDAAARV